jgi:hypothetical protein
VPPVRDRSASLRVALLALLTLLLGAGGCAAQEVPETLVRSSDPELRAMAARLLPDLARRSGMELREPVRLEMRSRAQLVRYLEAKLDEELDAEEARHTVAAYHLMGLVPDTLDLRGVLLDLYTEQVAGFYDPDSTALFILDDQPARALQGLLVHELVHAVQDQTADLDALTDPELGNDRATAAQAAIEGHATLVMLEYLTEQMRGAPVDLSEMPDFGADLRPALEGMRSQFPALAGAPRVIQEALLFPYLEGAGYVQRLWTEEERVAPFGPWLPTSTEQVLTGERGDEPVPVALEVEGGRVLHEDALGRLELGVLLEAHAGDGAGDAARGWGGDRWALVEDGAGGRGLILAVAWDEVAARDAFMDRLGAHLDAFPARAELESLDLPVGPVSLLRVGSALATPVTVLRVEGG